MRLSVLMGLRKGLSLIRGMRRTLTEDQQRVVAGAIVEHLESRNWKIEQGSVREGHSGLMGSEVVPAAIAFRGCGRCS
jgi:hypothetical protein